LARDNEPFTDIDAIYKNIDILVLPTQMKESLPIPILEAMSREILVISNRTEAIIDFIEKEKTGFILESGNADDICMLFDNILSNYPSFEIILKKAKETVVKYELNKMLEEYKYLYKII